MFNGESGSSFFKKLISTVKNYGLISWGEKVIVAVSGGADSTVLLTSLYELRHYLGIDLFCASFDHKIRKYSEKDIELVGNLCKKLSIPFYTEKGDVMSYAKKNRLNIEEAARILRYDFLIKAASKFKAEKIAVAHHLDDFAETMIMRLITGGGAAALYGLSPKTGIVIRPLINHTKSEVNDFAGQNSIKFIEDYTNFDTKILRNFVRLNIIPLFKERNPSFLKTIKNTADIIRKDDDFINRGAEKIFNEIAIKDGHGKKIFFNANDLVKIDDALLYRILKNAALSLSACPGISFDNYNFFVKKPVIYYKTLKTFIELIKSKKPNTYFNINSYITARKEYDKIIIELTGPENKLNFQSFCFNIKSKTKYNYGIDINLSGVIEKKGGHSIYITEIDKTFRIEKLDAASAENIKQNILSKKINLTSDTSYFDYDKIGFPITIRPFEAGDRFTPIGMNSPKKLKEYFIDKKVPLNIRKILPLIFFGEKIAWVSLYTISNDIKITGFTKNVGLIKLG